MAGTQLSGAIIERFENRVAGLLGTEAAVFMPSGTMAQQNAVRIHADRRGLRTVAFHPTCHLELVEAALDVAEERATWLFGRLQPTPFPDRHSHELLVGEAALDTTEEIASLFGEVIDRART